MGRTVTRRGGSHLLCSLLLALSTVTWAGDSFTARIPTAIATGEYAEAEMLITEAVKAGVITAAVAESYRRSVQQARKRASASQDDSKRPIADADSGKQGTPEPSPKRQLKPGPVPQPIPDMRVPTERNLGRIYVTYTKLNQRTMRYYSGRTSMVINLDRPLRPQAEEAVAARDSNHHLDEGDEPRGPAYREAVLDVFDTGTAVGYENRYRDIAYIRVRGREQQLIDFHGGAQSDTRRLGKSDRTENVVRAVARDHKSGRQFHEAATARWGLLADYSGD